MTRSNLSLNQVRSVIYPDSSFHCLTLKNPVYPNIPGYGRNSTRFHALEKDPSSLEDLVPSEWNSVGIGLFLKGIAAPKIGNRLRSRI
jgi:hypothetical protein